MGGKTKKGPKFSARKKPCAKLGMYHSAESALAGMKEAIARGRAEPGSNVYWCPDHQKFHFGRVRREGTPIGRALKQAGYRRPEEE